jgi:hypothetical protein
MASETSIRKKLASKKSSLQFLPVKMLPMSSKRNFDYNGKILKTAYAVDIIHNMILKYYFRKENSFNLHSTILKEKYGHQYKHYMDYLVSIGVIEMTMNYLAGRNARVYRIAADVLKGDIKRYANTDATLLKKYRNKVSQVEEAGIHDSLINPDIKARLVDDLFYVDVDYSTSIFFLDHLKDKGGEIYNRNVYAVQCIDGKHIFYQFDDYGRMHTNFTILKSFIRKNCLTIEGEPTHEIDIKNSQPLFLTKIIEDSCTKWVKDEEFELFKYLTRNGIYYQYVMDSSGIKDRRIVKEWTYKVLFGRNASNSKADKLFSSLFPTVHNFIKLYKKEKGDYRILSHELQRAESNLIFNKIARTIIERLPHVRMVTVHDSIIVQQRHRNEVQSIFDEMFENEFGKEKTCSEEIIYTV